ncbi:hypothetical protein JCM10135_01640 [Stetteria hydrogenophila]
MTGGEGDPCFYLAIAMEGVRRARRDLAEALDRTPAVVSSKPLIEGALRLLLGASIALSRAAREWGCKPGTPGPVVEEE